MIKDLIIHNHMRAGIRIDCKMTPERTFLLLAETLFSTAKRYPFRMMSKVILERSTTRKVSPLRPAPTFFD